MTKPKKWFLEKDPEDEKVVLMSSSGPLKKPNATQSLGAIRSISVPSDSTCGKYGANEAVMVCWPFMQATIIQTVMVKVCYKNVTQGIHVITQSPFCSTCM